MGLPCPQYSVDLLFIWFRRGTLHGVASARVNGGPLGSCWLVVCSHRILRYARWRGDQRMRVVVRHGVQRVLRRERVAVIIMITTEARALDNKFEVFARLLVCTRNQPATPRQHETSAPKSFGPARAPVLCCATFEQMPGRTRKKSIFGLPERENGGRQSTEKVEKCAGRETRDEILLCTRSEKDPTVLYGDPESIVKYEYFCVRVVERE